jgi:hypothetical protein
MLSISFWFRFGFLPLHSVAAQAYDPEQDCIMQRVNMILGYQG